MVGLGCLWVGFGLMGTAYGFWFKLAGLLWVIWVIVFAVDSDLRLWWLV